MPTYVLIFCCRSMMINRTPTIGGNGEIARFVTNCIMEYPPSCDFHLTQKSYSLDGMTQRRQFFHLINQFRFWEPYETSGVKGSWAAGCFNYWFEVMFSSMLTCLYSILTCIGTAVAQCGRKWPTRHGGNCGYD